MRGKRILINPIDDYCDLKGELIMAIIQKTGTLHEKAGYIEYKMPEQMARELLKNRKGDEKKKNDQEYLVQIVNEQFGLRLPVTKVFTTL